MLITSFFLKNPEWPHNVDTASLPVMLNEGSDES